jgi:hypothetical protein
MQFVELPAETVAGCPAKRVGLMSKAGLSTLEQIVVCIDTGNDEWVSFLYSGRLIEGKSRANALEKCLSTASVKS